MVAPASTTLVCVSRGAYLFTPAVTMLPRKNDVTRTPTIPTPTMMPPMIRNFFTAKWQNHCSGGWRGGKGAARGISLVTPARRHSFGARTRANFSPMAQAYTEASIKTLSSTEHIRLRPGMYIGRLGNGAHAEDGIYVLLKESIDNAIDEFTMGAGKK